MLRGFFLRFRHIKSTDITKAYLILYLLVVVGSGRKIMSGSVLWMGIKKYKIYKTYYYIITYYKNNVFIKIIICDFSQNTECDSVVSRTYIHCKTLPLFYFGFKKMFSLHPTKSLLTLWIHLLCSPGNFLVLEPLDHQQL